MVRRRDVEAAALLVGDVVDPPSVSRSAWVRGIGLFVLLLFLLPVAASSPEMLVAVFGIGLLAITIRFLQHRGRPSSRRAGEPSEGVGYL